MQTDLHVSFPFTFVSETHYMMPLSGSNARFMIPLPLCCPLPCVRIPFLPTTDHLCGNSPLVNTGSTISQNLGHMFPQKSEPFLICPLPFSTTLPPNVSRLNLVFTLSYTFLIHPMVMIPLIPLLRSSHLHPPYVTPPFCKPWSHVSSFPIPSQTNHFHSSMSLYFCFHVR